MISCAQHELHNHCRLPPPVAKHTDLNILGVLIHLAGDAINSQHFLHFLRDNPTEQCADIGVIIAGALIWQLSSPSRFYADPAVSLGISLIIFASAVPLTMRTGRILLEAAPTHIDVDNVRADLLSVCLPPFLVLRSVI